MTWLLDLFSPRIAYASFNEFLTNVNREIINPLILFLFALAIVFFLWGMVECLMTQDEAEGKTTCRQHMIWGIIGIAIMMCVWTIMNIVLNTFNIPRSEINPQENTVNLQP